MLQDRLEDLERQLEAMIRGEVSVAARADGSPVTAEQTIAGRAIRLVLSEMRREVPYDSCSVQELRGNRLVIVGGVGFENLDVILGESFDVDNLDTPNGEVIHRKRPLIVGDTEQYRAFRRGLHVGAGIFSWLGVPLLLRDEVIGMLALDKKEADFYTAIHARHALQFAGLVARGMAHESDDRESAAPVA